MTRIHTAGYAGRSVEDLETFIQHHNALLLDIRHHPQSRMKPWNGDNLRRTFGAKYFHCKFLGNVNHHTGGPITLADPRRGLDMVCHLARCRNLVLLCGCPKYEVCHRRTVAELLRTRGLSTQEMEWPRPAAPPGLIPALSLHQPWATLMALKVKRLETRSWPDGYRGPLVIHATRSTKYLGLCNSEPFTTVLRAAGFTGPQQLPLMAALGVCDLTEIVPTEKVVFLEGDYEHYFGDYSPGRFAWFTENMRAFQQPQPMPGHQGLWHCQINLDQVFALPRIYARAGGAAGAGVKMYFAQDPQVSAAALETALAEQRAREQAAAAAEATAAQARMTF